MADTYRVHGMTCGGCARSVTNALNRTTPTARVTVDLEARTVTVDGGLSADQVRKAVEGAGFDYQGPA